jgi:hypothetical protein
MSALTTEEFKQLDSINKQIDDLESTFASWATDAQKSIESIRVQIGTLKQNSDSIEEELASSLLWELKLLEQRQGMQRDIYGLAKEVLNSTDVNKQAQLRSALDTDNNQIVDMAEKNTDATIFVKKFDALKGAITSWTAPIIMEWPWSKNVFIINENNDNNTNKSVTVKNNAVGIFVDLNGSNTTTTATLEWSFLGTIIGKAVNVTSTGSTGPINAFIHAQWHGAWIWATTNIALPQNKDNTICVAGRWGKIDVWWGKLALVDSGCSAQVPYFIDNASQVFLTQAQNSPITKQSSSDRNWYDKYTSTNGWVYYIKVSNPPVTVNLSKQRNDPIFSSTKVLSTTNTWVEITQPPHDITISQWGHTILSAKAVLNQTPISTTSPAQAPAQAPTNNSTTTTTYNTTNNPANWNYNNPDVSYDEDCDCDVIVDHGVRQDPNTPVDPNNPDNPYTPVDISTRWTWATRLGNNYHDFNVTSVSHEGSIDDINDLGKGIPKSFWRVLWLRSRESDRLIQTARRQWLAPDIDTEWYIQRSELSRSEKKQFRENIRDMHKVNRESAFRAYEQNNAQNQTYNLHTKEWRQKAVDCDRYQPRGKIGNREYRALIDLTEVLDSQSSWTQKEFMQTVAYIYQQFNEKGKKNLSGSEAVYKDTRLLHNTWEAPAGEDNSVWHLLATWFGDYNSDGKVKAGPDASLEWPEDPVDINDIWERRRNRLLRKWKTKKLDKILARKQEKQDEKYTRQAEKYVKKEKSDQDNLMWSQIAYGYEWAKHALLLELGSAQSAQVETILVTNLLSILELPDSYQSEIGKITTEEQLVVWMKNHPELKSIVSGKLNRKPEELMQMLIRGNEYVWSTLLKQYGEYTNKPRSGEQIKKDLEQQTQYNANIQEYITTNETALKNKLQDQLRAQVDACLKDKSAYTPDQLKQFQESIDPIYGAEWGNQVLQVLRPGLEVYLRQELVNHSQEMSMWNRNYLAYTQDINTLIASHPGVTRDPTRWYALVFPEGMSEFEQNAIIDQYTDLLNHRDQAYSQARQNGSDLWWVRDAFGAIDQRFVNHPGIQNNYQRWAALIFPEGMSESDKSQLLAEYNALVQAKEDAIAKNNQRDISLWDTQIDVGYSFRLFPKLDQLTNQRIQHIDVSPGAILSTDFQDHATVNPRLMISTNIGKQSGNFDQNRIGVNVGVTWTYTGGGVLRNGLSWINGKMVLAPFVNIGLHKQYNEKAIANSLKGKSAKFVNASLDVLNFTDGVDWSDFIPWSLWISQEKLLGIYETKTYVTQAIGQQVLPLIHEAMITKGCDFSVRLITEVLEDHYGIKNSENVNVWQAAQSIYNMMSDTYSRVAENPEDPVAIQFTQDPNYRWYIFERIAQDFAMDLTNDQIDRLKTHISSFTLSVANAAKLIVGIWELLTFTTIVWATAWLKHIWSALAGTLGITSFRTPVYRGNIESQKRARQNREQGLTSEQLMDWTNAVTPSQRVKELNDMFGPDAFQILKNSAGTVIGIWMKAEMLNPRTDSSKLRKVNLHVTPAVLNAKWIWYRSDKYILLPDMLSIAQSFQNWSVYYDLTVWAEGTADTKQIGYSDLTKISGADRWPHNLTTTTETQDGYDKTIEQVKADLWANFQANFNLIQNADGTIKIVAKNGVAITGTTTFKPWNNINIVYDTTIAPPTATVNASPYIPSTRWFTFHYTNKGKKDTGVYRTGDVVHNYPNQTAEAVPAPTQYTTEAPTSTAAQVETAPNTLPPYQAIVDHFAAKAENVSKGNFKNKFVLTQTNGRFSIGIMQGSGIVFTSGSTLTFGIGDKVALTLAQDNKTATMTVTPKWAAWNANYIDFVYDYKGTISPDQPTTTREQIWSLEYKSNHELITSLLTWHHTQLVTNKYAWNEKNYHAFEDAMDQGKYDTAKTKLTTMFADIPGSGAINSLTHQDLRVLNSKLCALQITKHKITTISDTTPQTTDPTQQAYQDLSLTTILDETYKVWNGTINRSKALERRLNQESTNWLTQELMTLREASLKQAWWDKTIYDAITKPNSVGFTFGYDGVNWDINEKYVLSPQVITGSEINITDTNILDYLKWSLNSNPPLLDAVLAQIKTWPLKDVSNQTIIDALFSDSKSFEHAWKTYYVGGTPRFSLNAVCCNEMLTIDDITVSTDKVTPPSPYEPVPEPVIPPHTPPYPPTPTPPYGPETQEYTTTSTMSPKTKTVVDCVTPGLYYNGIAISNDSTRRQSTYSIGGMSTTSVKEPSHAYIPSATAETHIDNQTGWTTTEGWWHTNTTNGTGWWTWGWGNGFEWVGWDGDGRIQTGTGWWTGTWWTWWDGEWGW